MSVLTDEGWKPETFESRQAGLRTPERLESFFAGGMAYGELEGLEREQLEWACSVAHELYEDGDVEAAQKVLLALSVLDHRNAGYLYRVAVMTAALGQRAEAIHFCSRAVAMAPEVPEAFVLRGELLLETGQLEESVQDLLRAVELDPEDRNPAVARARLLLQGILRAASLRLGGAELEAEPGEDGA